ncbi:hypothetical protein [Paracoccus alkanivorans]|uniref:DUF3035 domain-containing protein n=1 Tax=Paracoccus alkanivorans TaxID=2116655 RepID=A0A3M0LZT4_9RHOB|nr:hypothetical protein [Paracoccus alkanivorans]RMC30992.1 hypothetical protein C9E81_21105 [Paracoccus alkanivorans]
MTRLAQIALCAALSLLSACADRGGDYPSLLPMDQLLAEPELPPDGADPTVATSATQARADALRARADALRRPVIEPETQSRMQRSDG